MLGLRFSRGILWVLTKAASPIFCREVLSLPKEVKESADSSVFQVIDAEVESISWAWTPEISNAEMRGRLRKRRIVIRVKILSTD